MIPTWLDAWTPCKKHRADTAPGSAFYVLAVAAGRRDPDRRRRRDNADAALTELTGIIRSCARCRAATRATAIASARARASKSSRTVVESYDKRRVTLRPVAR